MRTNLGYPRRAPLETAFVPGNLRVILEEEDMRSGEVTMIATRVQFITQIPGTACPDCGHRQREAVLVNQYGLVLSRGSVCVSCGHRHRLAAHPELSEIAG